MIKVCVCVCADQGQNIKNIIDQSHLENIEQDLELSINLKNISFLNYETSPPLEVQITETEYIKGSSLVINYSQKRMQEILDCTGGFLAKDALEFSKLVSIK